MKTTYPSCFYKISLVIILVSISQLFNNWKLFADSEKNCFITTAYYSPIEWQKFYYNWSFEDEISMNWEWKHTASWKEPYFGALAWASKYPFGTRIYLEWYGIGVIEDRGSDIVKKWERWDTCDRIDIWMWTWSEWLNRALNWWKDKLVYWEVLAIDYDVSLKFWENIVLKYTDLVVNPETNNVEDIKSLQELFKKIWLYKWDIDWKYESIKDTLIEFQIKHKIVKSKKDEAVWWYWTKTKNKLINLYGEDPLKQEDNETKKNLAIKVINEKANKILEFWDIYISPEKTDKSDVEKIQNLFLDLWLYKGKIDWDYNSIKKDILKIQKRLWIIKNEKSLWAWYFWNKTKKAMISYYSNNESLENISYSSNKLVLKQSEKNILHSSLNKIITYSKEEANWDTKKELEIINNYYSKFKKVYKTSSDSKTKLKLEYLIKLMDDKKLLAYQ